MPKKSPPNRKAGRPLSGDSFITLLDILGHQWALRVLWELRDERLLSFRQLRQACDDVGPTVLNERLRELRDAGFIENGDGEGYGLTALGRDLELHLSALAKWSHRWFGELRRG